MPDRPHPPIVTDDRGDIAVFVSVEATCREIEAIDVAAGAYETFDGVDRHLSIAVADPVVRMRLDTSLALAPEELLARLKRFITRVGPGRIGVQDVEGLSLDSALNILSRFVGVRGVPEFVL